MLNRRRLLSGPFLTAPFLTAQWRDLVMLNFPANPELLLPLVPQGTELDFYEGKTYVSIVGFMFLRARLLGFPIPGHQQFEEVNLRFYIRRVEPDFLRRGVVFVKEIAPRWAVAQVANLVYNENYMVCPMRHEIVKTTGARPPAAAPNQQTQTEQAEYAWLHDNRWNRVGGRRTGPYREPEDGSLDEFIVKRYWDYGRDRNGRTREYRVNHVPWQVAPIENVLWDCDISASYGSTWNSALEQPPVSSLLVDGSAVSVMRSTRLTPQKNSARSDATHYERANAQEERHASQHTQGVGQQIVTVSRSPHQRLSQLVDGAIPNHNDGHK